GDTNYLPSTSGAVTQTVNAPATTTTTTTTTVSSSPNPSTSGQLVTFTAAVNSTSATGTVTFYNGTQTLGTGALSGGTATYSTAAFTPGSYSITASYPGDTNYLPSTSGAVTQTVNQFTILLCTSPPTTGSWVINSSCTLATST